ncbi:MAG: ABC transporter permease [Acidimicrobiales bacterium]|nr:ABC transporter permease [Acidimicrobiales bacterium]
MPPLGVLVGVIGLWYTITYLVLEPHRRFLLRAPHEVVAVGFADRDNLSEIIEGAWLTAQVAALGLVLAVAIGVGVAVLMSRAPWVERSLYPYAVALQAVPILAIVPLIALWFGYGFGARVVVCVIISLFPIIANTLFGLLSVPPPLHDLFSLHRASPRDRLWKLQLPHALPSFFVGVRISSGLSVVGAIVGDFFFRQGPPGLGQLIDRYGARLRSEELIAAIIVASLLGVAAFWLAGWVQRRVVGHWHHEFRPVDPSLR